MAKNEFHKDAFTIFKKVSKQIADEHLTDDFNVVVNTLLFAIGLEKLLKSLLYDINPLYVLESPDFKNSAPVFYSASIKDKNEIAKKPDEDVIAFQASVLRATTFSKAALDNKNTLMKIKNARDIIAHHNLNKLKIDELRLLLNRDFYPLLKEFSDEHNLGGQTNFFNNLHAKLASISGLLQNDIEKQIKLKIEGREAYWTTLKGTHTYNIKRTEKETAELLQKDYTFPTECPSCKNQAIVYTTPIMSFDNYRNEMVQTGLETKALKCMFCNLEVTDYKELDFLKVKPNTVDKERVIREYSDINIDSETQPKEE
jgi:hypothetical protein